MARDRDEIYLEEIGEFGKKIVEFTSGISYESFAADEKLQLAVLKLIENIGEASKRLSELARERHSNVNWRKAMAMRDKLVHDYMDVDLEIVWNVASKEVPALLESLKA
jgi:uncharacterized protein with HEPN domain